MKKESYGVIIKSPLVIRQFQNFAKGTPHEKCTRKVQMQRTEELPVKKEILKNKIKENSPTHLITLRPEIKSTATASDRFIYF